MIAISLTPSARAQLLADGIAAVVNDKVITYVQINQQVAETEKLLRQNLQGEELFERVKEAKLNVLKALIDRELIIQDFKEQGGFIPDTYTNERINDIIRDEYGGDRVAFVKTLYERGVTMQKYKDEIKDNAIVGYERNKTSSRPSSSRPTRSSSTTSKTCDCSSRTSRSRSRPLFCANRFSLRKNRPGRQADHLRSAGGTGQGNLLQARHRQRF